MGDWNAVFDSLERSGVYHVGPDVNDVDIRAAAALRGLEFTRVDLSEVNSKSGFLTEMARALEFPAYFGMNWDALYECLTDLSWKPASGYVLFLAAFHSLVRRAGPDLRPAIEVFHAVAEYWRPRGVPFFIILSDGASHMTGDCTQPRGVEGRSGTD